MTESTIVLRSPVKSTLSPFKCASPNSPTHHGTVIILKDNNNHDLQPIQPTKSSNLRNSTVNQPAIPPLNSCQPKLYYAGYTGLYNLGNTCYVNCVLQLLSHVPQFCDAICSMSFESLGLEQPSDVPMATSSHNPTRLKGGGRGLLKALEAQPRRVPCYLAYELHGTFNIIWSGKCMVYSPLNMIAAVRRLLPSFEPCAMEDAQEFLEALLAAVTDEIKTNKLADTNIISDLLGFSSESQILCEQCRFLSVTKTDETFITLTFSEKMLCDSRGSSRRRSCHLTEMLAHFYQWEALSTPFQCSICTVRSSSREGTKAQKRLLISKLPQVLHIVLRRFRSMPQTNLRRPTSRQARQMSHKITMHVNFDEYLDMAPYCVQSTFNSPSLTRSKSNESSTGECLYRLRGVIVHYGKSINTGHFVAFVYNDLLGEWLRCDDHIIEQTTFESVKTSDAYILVYSRCASNTLSPSIVLNNKDSSESSSIRKRKRAISVDHLTEPKEDLSTGDIKTEMNAQSDNSENQGDLSRSLNFFCVNLDPLTNGLRRRAQSLNFAIRSSQSQTDPSDSTVSEHSPPKRRRRNPINVYSSPANDSSRYSIVRSQAVALSPRKPVIQTRKKSSPVVIANDSLCQSLKFPKTTRRRRRSDPFTRKKRIAKQSEPRNRRNIELNMVPYQQLSYSASPSNESLFPSPSSSSTCSSTTVICEKLINNKIPTARRIGRIRIQRCVEGMDGNSDTVSILSGESLTSSSVLSQTTQSLNLPLSTALISSRRSNSLNNIVSNPSSS